MILLSILADLNYIVVWMVSAGLSISTTYSPSQSLCGSFQVYHLQLVSPSPSCFIFFALRQGPSILLSFGFLWFLFCGQPERHNPLFGKFSFLLLTITWSGLQTDIWWSVCISKSLRILYASFSTTDSGLYLYYLFVWRNLNFFYNSLWITFPAQSCFVLYFFCAYLSHLLNILFVLPFLSPHNLYYYYYW